MVDRHEHPHHPHLHAHSVPTPALLISAASARTGGGSTESAHLHSPSHAAHAHALEEWGQKSAAELACGEVDVKLEGRRKEVLEGVLELFGSNPRRETFERDWREDAVFEDPLIWCRGWFAMPKLFQPSKTLSHRSLASTNDPPRIIYAQTQEYTLRLTPIKKTIHSIVIIDLDKDDKIIHLEDRWWGAEQPTRWGSWWLRRLNARVLPWLVRVPKEEKRD